ncbi:hypothetical protein ACNF49_43915 [Actinomadura sp. ATCC 39365]
MAGRLGEEGEGVRGRPHHHRRRTRHRRVHVDHERAAEPSASPPLLDVEPGLQAAVPGGDPLIGPHQRLGPLGVREFDHRGRVEVDQPILLDRDVQRVPQGGSDAVHSGRADRPPMPHLGPLLGSAAGAGGDDDVVELLDRIEHPRHIRHPQPIQPDIAEVGGEVQADVRLVGAAGSGVDLPLAPQELLHPLGHGHSGIKVLPSADLAPYFFDRRQGLGVLEHRQHQLGDLPLDVRVLIQRQQRPGMLQLGLRLLQRGKAPAAQRITPPTVGVRGQLQLVGPPAMGAAPPLLAARTAQLRTGLAQPLPRRFVPAGTRLEGGSVHRRCRAFPLVR